MKIRILPSANADLRRGYRFYERQSEGVGDYFLDSLYSDIDSILLFAGIHPQRGELFRFRSRRFPYWVYYRMDGDTAFVVAVLDARRAPWKTIRREILENEKGNKS